MTPARRESFVAVDGTALAYRSHFAFIQRPLTTRDGEVTSAVFGFILTLRRIVEELKPDALLVVFDAPGKTFRNEMYDQYKAQRERMPPDLKAQLPRIRDYLDAAGIPHLAVEGVEADDVLATLALRAVRHGMDGVVVSNDKDLLQIVGEGARVVALGRGTEPFRAMTPDAVRESFGVTPAQIVDFLSLTGDSSDNIPGVPGVGKKTAAKLLEEHGSLDALLEAAEGLKKGKLRENLLAARESVLRSRDLVRLRTDVETEPPESFRTREPDPDVLNRLYDELDFQSLKSEERTTKPSDRSGYSLADSAAAHRELEAAARKAGRLAFAAITETGGALRAPLLGAAIAVGDGRAWYVPFPEGEPVDEVRALLEDADLPKWGEDTKRDLLVFQRAGVHVQGLDFDTTLASYVLDPSRRNHSVDAAARERFGVQPIDRESLTGKGRQRIALADVPAADLAPWAAEAADLVFRLRERLETELAARDLEKILTGIELPLVRVLARAEAEGVRLDTDYLAELSESMGKEIRELERRACDAAGEDFNLGSPKQVAELLFEKLGLKPLRRTKTGYSTDADVLAALAGDHEVPGLILRHREVSKLKSTYVDALPQMVNPETGRVHTTFQQAVAATGRLSSADPNLQNVPIRTEEGRRIRKAFVPSREGHVLVSCDYSQIELRILAHMARDEPLLAAFREDRDVHRATAALVFDVPESDVTAEQRGQAKTINFGVIYGMGAVNLGRSLGITTREAARFIEAYFDRYPGVARFVTETQERARENLYVETLAGRRRPVPEIASADHRTRSFGERIAVNTPIQGTAADILKIAMVRVQDALDDRDSAARILLTVHDELVLDCPEAEREEVVQAVRAEMSGAMELSVPLKVDAGWGPDWSAAH